MSKRPSELAGGDQAGKVPRLDGASAANGVAQVAWLYTWPSLVEPCCSIMCFALFNKSMVVSSYCLAQPAALAGSGNRNL